MPITPSEIRLTAFRIAWRGYATDEVDAFMDRVEQELSRLTRDSTSSTPAAQEPAPGPDGTERHALRTGGRTSVRTGEDEDTGGGRAAEAVTVLQLAEQALGEARAQARVVREGAAAEAERVVADASALREKARQEADHLLATARARASSAEHEVREQRRSEVAELERRCAELRSAAAELEVAYQRQRAELVSLLEGQLRRVQQEDHLRIVRSDADAGAVA